MGCFIKFVLLVGFACVLLGCNDPSQKRIVGTWTISNADKVMNRVARDEDETPDETETTSSMTLEFAGNGVIKTKTRMGSVDQEKQGTWKMTGYDSHSKTMTISCNIQMQTTEHEVSFIDDDSIELVPPNMAGTTMKLKFDRQ